MKSNLMYKERQLKLNQNEVETYHFLQQYDNDWASIFKAYILQGRDKITQRLVTSLHRENLVHAAEHSRIINKTAIASLDIPSEQVLEISFPQSQQILYAPIIGQHAFNRIDVIGPFYLRHTSHHDVYRIQHPNELLDIILNEQPEYQNAASEQFRQDLINSANNMSFALSYQYYTMQQHHVPLYDLITQNEDSYLRSEQSVIEGHPLHPGAKLRKGLNAAETFKYSSEFAQVIDLNVMLIHQTVSRTMSLDTDYNLIIREQFPELVQQLQTEFSDINIDDYHVMIVHPWQLTDVLHRDYQLEIDQQLIRVSSKTLPYYAGLSFRTLVPKFPSQLPHIKLSTNVHITGEIRTLSEQTTHNGPIMTKILNDILANDTLFNRDHADVIAEIAGIHFYTANDKGDYQTERSEQLGTLFRQNIYDLIPSNVTPVIPSSLVANYPYNDETPVITLIKQYQQTMPDCSFEQAAQLWITMYSKALLGLVVPLVTKYGIALEAHLQNTIATFKDNGLIDKMYIRDFEGLRIDETQLNKMGYRTDHFHEKSRILTDSKTSVFNKAFYSTVQNHLGEIILTIAQYSEVQALEHDLWQNVQHILLELFEQIEQSFVTVSDHNQQVTYNERINEFKDTMFSPMIDYKCVTTMRLEDEAHHYTYIKVNNPLKL
ncbi:IucA/IucC family protein [Staphylococcus simiae]|uniref:Siderophore biosynthesis protein n=1 Tax=Staphylococcus simiae CCM 7213 = CCUG 51256 TaxID=911238 RepID=G5JJM2_9STAP|nr:IucA/IucC family protein [Staphylococcus simiae]EHJ07620.1 hypothetical protein SS7213T_08407 [Staphylococcus simiae CCM 7213 = CCUG 51256]PNZ13756.1 IucA/IucC family siderophore biosynthesis protein [Staphylococcus simiae]SNV78066.1 Siderophore biosynthesis protein [Staphylococcus simiae]